MSAVIAEKASAVCPACHTPAQRIDDPGTLAWVCHVCLQSWNASRLEAVRGYAAFCAREGR